MRLAISGCLLILGILLNGCAMTDNGRPVLKVGIISDIQGSPFRNDWGMHNLAQAFEILAEKKIDVLLVVGDIAETGDLGVYRLYNEIFKEKFGGKQPEQVFCDGNHDFMVARQSSHEKIFSDYCNALGQAVKNPYHTIIGGYDFIAFSTDDGYLYSPDKLKDLDAVLCKASKRDPRRPVFVLTHFPPANTVSGSHDASGRTVLFELFRKYPQVVSFSGHTHYPLEDERTIWQGEFTAVETSTLSYGCMEEKPFNAVNGILPFAREVTQMMYMEIYPDYFEIRRYNVTDRREIAKEKRWRVSVPYHQAEAIYTSARSEKAESPEFAADSEILIRYDYGYAYLIFDGSVSGDFAQFYDVDIAEQVSAAEWKSVKNCRYVSNFYRLEKNRDGRQVFKLPVNLLIPGKTYCFRVFPVESFGKRGSPLELVCSIPPTWHLRKKQAITYPQE